MHYSLCIFNEYIKQRYFDMMRQLFNTFINQATKHGMSKENRMKYWSECDNDFLKNLNTMEGNAQKSVYSFMKPSVIPSYNLDIFRLLHEYALVSIMQTSTRKWSSCLTNEVKSFKQY